MKYRRIIFLLIIIAVNQFLLSCSPEKKIAKQFLEKEKQGSILVISPEIIYMTNLKKDEIKNSENMDQYTLDSVLYYNSKYLQFISDSAFVEKYVNNMLEEFQNLGFDTYTEDYFDVFLSVESPSYILNIAQFELEEDYSETVDEDETMGSLGYFVKVKVNSIKANSWFELSTVNSSEDKKEILYDNYTISDYLNGYFYGTLFSSEIKYEYTIDTLKVNDVYYLAEYLGKLYAAYVFDYLMNKEIEKQFSLKTRLPEYLHYNRITNKFYSAEENRFFIIE